MQLHTQQTIDWITTLYHVFVIITGFGTLLGGIVLAVFVVRSKSNKLLAQEWHDLAEVKAARIADLEKKVEDLGSRLETLSNENEALRRLNLELQKQLSTITRGM